MIKLIYIVVIALLGAIIAHIVLLFFYPTLEQQTFWSEIEQVAPINQFARLPANGRIAERADPSARLQLCHFDLSNNPVHFHAQGDVPFWSLSIYNNKGDNLYSINDRTSPEPMLDLVLGDAIQIIDYRQTVTDKIKKPVFTQQNISKGFAILRVLRMSDNWDKNIEDFQNSATCKEIDY